VKNILLALFVSLLTLLPLSSIAACQGHSVIVSLEGGAEYFSSKRHLQNTGIGYGIVGYNFTEHWGIEGLAGMFTSYSRRTSNYDQRINGKLFAVDGVYHFSPYYRNMIEPFVLAGVGATALSETGSDANDEGNINAGVGVHVYANPAVALRLEARDFYTIVGGKNDVLLGGGVSFFI
jgi:OOP family OmpA-OmpF porin